MSKMKRKETIIKIEADVYARDLGNEVRCIYEIYAYTNMGTQIPDNNTKYKVGDIVEVIIK